MSIKFYKMQGLGNDYVYIDCFRKNIEQPPELSKKISDRHFGIGSEGLVLLLPSKVADLKMSIYNSDGTEGQMDGNVIRCVGKLAYMLDICKSENIAVETSSGIKALKLYLKNGDVSSVRADMGSPALEREKIPVEFGERRVVNAPVTVDGHEYRITCVSMGDPHAVMFINGVDDLDISGIGSNFENSPMFPKSVNTEFVEVLGRDLLKVRVFKHGIGESDACGTGACAAVVAACINGICPRSQDVGVQLRGGTLKIAWDNDNVWMTGPAELVFTGEMNVDSAFGTQTTEDNN